MQQPVIPVQIILKWDRRGERRHSGIEPVPRSHHPERERVDQYARRGGNVTLWNRAAEEISGYPPPTSLGTTTSGRGCIRTTTTGRRYCAPSRRFYRGESRRIVRDDDRNQGRGRAYHLVELTQSSIPRANDRARWRSAATSPSAESANGNAASERATQRVQQHREPRPQKSAHYRTGYLGLARTECDSDHLEDVDIALTRIDQIVNQTLALARHGRTIDKKESTDLAQLAEHCWETVDTARGELVIDDLPRTNADPRAVRHLFENLFRNTIEHGGDDVTVRVGP